MTRRRSRIQEERHTTITSKWMLNHMGVILLVLLVLAFAFLYAIRSYYYTASRQYLQTKVNAITAVMSRYSEDSDSNFSSELRSTIENFSDKNRMELEAINARGKVVLTSSGFTPDSTESMPDYESTMNGGEGYWTGISNGERIMAVSVDISALNADYSAIRVISSLEQVQSVIHTYTILVIAICLGVLFLVFLTGIYFIRSIASPIRQINTMTRKFAKGDFSERIQSDSRDEIGELCNSVNAMADELATTENMKNEFISSVSHELRTPLTAIKGWAETLRMENDQEMQAKGMNVIINETERLTEMVEELLDFSRIQSGRLSLHCATMDVLAELGDAVLIYMEKARKEHIRIIYNEPEMLPFVCGDKNRIRQVFINVVDNAIKYSNPGGTITISAEAVESMIQVTVTDNGVGISEKDLPRVKDKFFKANQTRRGSGIGLAVADEIIAMHNGTLEITSELGVGTAVVINLPIEQKLEK